MPDSRIIDCAHAALPEPAEIRRALDLIWPRRERFELRVLHREGERVMVEAGLFSRAHVSAMIDLAAERNAAAAVYVNLNPIRADYRHPATDRLQRYAKGLVRNEDVERREFLAIDLDPVRPTETSATKAQVQKAAAVATAIKTFLTSLGWPLPVECASGNGSHLLYRIDLPRTSRAGREVQHIERQGRQDDGQRWKDH